MNQAAARSPIYFYLGLGSVTASTLALEIIEIRLLSVVTWYHLAFFVISMAMFGMTLGALRIQLAPRKFAPDNLARTLPRAALFASAAAGLAYLDQLCLAPVTVVSFSIVVVFARLALTMAVPFYFAGVAVTLALTRSPYPIGRTYGADLAGAALGALLVLPLLNLLDGPGAIFAAGSLMALGGWLLARWARQTQTGRWALAIGAAWLALAVFNAATPFGLDPIVVKGRIEQRQQFAYEKWNSFSRIVAYRPEKANAASALWAASPRTTVESIEMMRMNIDGEAGTNMIRTADGAPDFLRADVTALAYEVRRGKVAIIGVGGGKDIQTALAAENESVLGLEINPIFVSLLTDRFRDYTGLTSRPEVRLEVDEARGYFTRSREKFDIIQASLIDTWAATGAGAFSLSENSLYTVDAWRIFLNRLTDDGVFTVSRWYSPDRLDETARLVSLAAASLFDLGINEPEKYILLGAHQRVATIIVGHRPFSADDIARFKQRLAEMEFTPLLIPGEPAASPLLEQLRGATDRADLERLAATSPLDLSPPTDERPFFFNLLRLSRPWEILPYIGGSTGTISGNLLATLTLLVILLLSLIFGVAIVFIPYRWSPPEVARPQAAQLLYFTLIGLGFMLVEIALLQRLSVYLGHPVYSLAVVLFSLILFTGVGSLAGERLPLNTPRRLAIYAFSLGALLLLIALVLPRLTAATVGWGLFGRVLMSILLLAPAGFGMGQAFPTGMRLSRRDQTDPTPWLWGVNGAAGVLAGVVGVILNIAFGITTTLVVGAACYTLLALVARPMTATSRR